MRVIKGISVVFALAGAIAFAQIPQGTVQGNVTDASGAAVPNAGVTLLNQLTGIQKATSTNNEGLYSFNYLDSGTYRVTITATGFTTAAFPDIKVDIGNTVRVDAKLNVGDVSSTVEVSGVSALLQTDTAVVGGVVSQREVRDMPVRGREFSQLALLMPGVRSVGTTGGALITQFATAVQVGGTDSAKNDYSVDGVDNTFNIWNGPAMNPSIDAIQEFRIDKSQFSAEYGRGGAQLQLITKGGTNQFHGAAWEYLRNGALNAGNYTSHVQDTLKRNQFGANLGGPIKRDKLFFFFNWESQRERTSVQQLGTVFTDAMRNGDFSGYPKTVKDPQTGNPFPNNAIPLNRISTVSLGYMDAMMPRANLPGYTLNLLRPATTAEDWNQYVSRVDYQVSAKDSLFFRFSDQPRNGIAAPLSATAIADTEDFHFLNTGAGWNRTWSPRFLTETRVGWHREKLLLQSQTIPNLPTETIRGFGSIQPPATRLPTVTITDTSGFAQYGFPLGFTQNAIEFSQNATFSKGKHLVKFGFNGRKTLMDKTKSPEYQISLAFSNTYTGTGPGDYLLGLPFTASEILGFVGRAQRYGDYAAFIQDDWKVASNLTLSVGLRYEINLLPLEKNNLWGSFSPDLQKVVLAGDHVVQSAVPDPYILNSYAKYLIPASQTNLPQRTLAFGDHNNFAPRFGFAWRPLKTNTTVIRGGYGVFYLLEDGNIAFNNTGTIPYGGTISTQNTAPSPNFTVADPFSAGVANLPLPGSSYRDPRMRTPYLQQTTFGIQQQLPWRIVADVNFQDQNSQKLESSWNLNQPAPGPGAVATRRPYQTFGSSIGGTLHEGHARYDALEASVRHQGTHFTWQWSHTFAKNMIRTTPVDPYNRDLYVGPGNYVPNLDKVHFVADLPFGKGRKWMTGGGLMEQVLGGWIVSGFATLYQSGAPFTIGWNGDPANVGVTSARANRIRSGSISNPSAAAWFDTAAFVAPAPYTFGNAGTGILFGPSSRAFDAAIDKNFQVRENLKLQFRTELFNAFNHPNLAMPQSTLNGLNFGQILTKTLDPRVIQFALRLDF
jgi:hypothetical protein